MRMPMKTALGAVVLCASALALSACVYGGPYRDGYDGYRHGRYYGHDDRDRFHHDHDHGYYEYDSD